MKAPGVPDNILYLGNPEPRAEHKRPCLFLCVICTSGTVLSHRRNRDWSIVSYDNWYCSEQKISMHVEEISGCICHKFSFAECIVAQWKIPCGEEYCTVKI